jgi:hypothetical protein
MSTTEADNALPPETADGDKHWTIVDVPETALTPLALQDQPATDRGFITEGGTRLRARLVTIARQDTRAPTNGGVKLAASGMNLSLTLAVLDETSEVARDAAGNLLITDIHEVVWTDASFRNPDFDPAAHIDLVLRQQAAVLETRMAKRAAAVEALSSWGGAPMVSEAVKLELADGAEQPADAEPSA